MYKNILRVGLFTLLSLYAVSGFGAPILKVIDAYNHINKHRSCLKDLVEAVKFGAFSNLKIDKCGINNGKVIFIVDVKLREPFSNNNIKQFMRLVDAFGLEVGELRKDVLNQKICKFTSMPKRLKCYTEITDTSISATAYEGANLVTLSFIDK